MNPLNNQTPNNNPIMNMLQFLDKGGSPQQLAEQLVSPQAKNAMNQIKKMYGGATPQDIAMQLCQARGIDPNSVMQLAQRLGSK